MTQKLCQNQGLIRVFGIYIRCAHLILFFLMILFVSTKIPYIVDNTFAFQFDHGKDSLAVLEMIVSRTPSLIGPWTSIPGLFFGPGWYYLLLPGYILSAGNPAAAVVTMVILVVIQIYIAYKYFGLIEATMVATVPTFFMVSQSAWNPHPMTLISFVILAILKTLETQPKLTPKKSIILGFTSSLGFHFSTAFAIFYLPFIIISFFLKRVKVNFKQFLILFAAFFSGFIPQIIFEMRHDFIETRAIIKYFSSGSMSINFIEKIKDVFLISFGEYKLAAFPEIVGSSKLISTIVICFSLTVIVIGLIEIIKKRRSMYLYQDLIMWIFLPLIGLSFLHYNLWYVLGAAPAVLLLVAQLVRSSPKPARIMILMLFVLTPLSKIVYYYQHDRALLLENPNLLAVKLDVIGYVEDKIGDRNFSSYQYVPDIYDYSYQYLYFWKAYNGKSLPIEFSYQPNETSYVKEKNALLSVLPVRKGAPEMIFYIVEQPNSNANLLSNWWNHQASSEIVNEKTFGSEVTVYDAVSIKY